MSEIKLLHCPFCGGEASLCKIKDADLWIVKCWNRGCKMRPRTDECESKEEAIAIWNTRKPMERIVERLEQKVDEHANNGQYFGADGWTDHEAKEVLQQKTYEKAIEIVKEEGGIE